jgi:hypothetical protein
MRRSTRARPAALTLGIVGLALVSFGCAGGGNAGAGGNTCNEECLATCRANCTSSPGADSYDECTEMCNCGCGD